MRAGVVEQHIDPTELLLGGGEDARAVVRLADVAGDADSRSFSLADESMARLLQHVGTTRDDGNAGARAHKIHGGSEADTLAAAGDQRAAAVHSHVDHLL